MFENKFSQLTVGVLALQGAFREHVRIMKQLGAQAVEVRKPVELDGLDALIIPGGESTSMGLIAERWGMVEPLQAWIRRGQPTWGTCAGMIMLADRAVNQKQGGQTLLGGLDVTVDRNYFGRQVNSFEAQLEVPVLGDLPYPAIFIRAPAITELGSQVEGLAWVAAEQEGEKENVIVAARQASILATAFHPELTDDVRWHRLFLEMVLTHHSANAMP